MTEQQQNLKTTPLATLPPADRAYLALSEAHNEQALVELAGKYVDVTEIKDETDYQLVMRGGIELMKARTAIEATGKAARKDANDYRTAVLKEERRLIAITSPEETRLRGMRTDYDDEQERIAEEVRHIEQRRVADITERIQAIRNQTEGLLGADADAIQMRLDAVNSIVCTASVFSEFTEQACAVLHDTVTSLKTALAERVALDEQQAEQQRIAEEQAARQTEIDRRLELIAEAEARIEAERKAAENRKLAEERAEQERQAEVERKAEQERLDQEESARLEAERIAEAERQEALRPEKEKLLEWLKRLYEVDQIALEALTLKTIQADVIDQIGDIAKIAAQRVRAL